MTRQAWPPALSVPQALEIIRGCHGLNLVGGDLVEVSPAYDTSGNTALLVSIGDLLIEDEKLFEPLLEGGVVDVDARVNDADLDAAVHAQNLNKARKYVSQWQEQQHAGAFCDGLA